MRICRMHAYAWGVNWLRLDGVGSLTDRYPHLAVAAAGAAAVFPCGPVFIVIPPTQSTWRGRLAGSGASPRRANTSYCTSSSCLPADNHSFRSIQSILFRPSVTVHTLSANQCILTAAVVAVCRLHARRIALCHYLTHSCILLFSMKQLHGRHGRHGMRHKHRACRRSVNASSLHPVSLTLIPVPFPLGGPPLRFARF